MQLPHIKGSKFPRVATESPDSNMAEGESQKTEDDESEELMNHISKEAVDAVHARDHVGFRSALHVMMSDYMDKMSEPESMED